MGRTLKIHILFWFEFSNSVDPSSPAFTGAISRRPANSSATAVNTRLVDQRYGIKQIKAVLMQY